MKQTIQIFLLVLCYVAAAAQKDYTLSKEDFIAQFNDTAEVRGVYCYDSEGQRFWLFANSETIVVLRMADGKEKKIRLYSIRYREGFLEGVEVKAWTVLEKVKRTALKEVASISIQRRGEMVTGYFTVDSCRSIAQGRNDSLKQLFDAPGTIAYLVTGNDSLALVEQACYHLTFRDGKSTEYGVVQRMTADSIVISNVFSPAVAAKKKQDYHVYRYAISDITEVRLFRYKIPRFEKRTSAQWKVAVVAGSRVRYFPCWYMFNRRTCQITLGRRWLISGGFASLQESDGNVAWIEK